MPSNARVAGSGTVVEEGTDVTENVTSTPAGPWVVRIQEPGVSSKPANDSVPSPVTVRF